MSRARRAGAGEGEGGKTDGVSVWKGVTRGFLRVWWEDKAERVEPLEMLMR